MAGRHPDRVDRCRLPTFAALLLGAIVGFLAGSGNTFSRTIKSASASAPDPSDTWARVQDDIAMRHPEPPSRKALIYASIHGMVGVLDSTLARWFTAPYKASATEVMTRIGAQILSTPVDGFAGACAAIAKVNTLDRLKEITCPVFIIVGEEDHGTPPEMARAIHANLPGSKLLVIKSAAHLSNVEQAEIFNRALVDFLARVN